MRVRIRTPETADLSECEEGLLDPFKTPDSIQEDVQTPTGNTSVRPATWKRWCSIAFQRMKNELLASPSTGAFIETETQEISMLDNNKHCKKHLKDKGLDEHNDDDGAIPNKLMTILTFIYDHRDWVLVALVGFFTAASAAWIGFVAEQLTDLKLGFCKGLPWLSRELCCGSRSAVNILSNACQPMTKFNTAMIVPQDSKESAEIAAEVGPALTLQHPQAVNQLAVWTSWQRLLGGGAWVDFAVYMVIGTFLAYAGGIIVVALAPTAAGSGIPEVKTVLGGFWLKRVLHPWTLAVKTLGLALAVASGLGLGKEGPMVHIGAAWAAILGRHAPLIGRPKNSEKDGIPDTYTNTPSQVNALISAGSAAGVASAFGAPLGGVLFALEEVSTYFPPSTLYKTLFCAVVSAVVLKNLSGAHSGNGSIFELDTLGGSWAVSELPAFILIALIGGFVGALFVIFTKYTTIYRMEARSNKRHGLIAFIYRGGGLRELVCVAAFANACNYFCPLLRVSSIYAMTQLFSRCGQMSEGADVYGLCSTTQSQPDGLNTIVPNESLWLAGSLLTAFLLYSANAVLTYGTCIPAGIFVPTLCMGALLGRVIGHMAIATSNYASKISWAAPLFPTSNSIHPGAYSLLGAIAVLSGVSRMTVSLVIIAFEMSGGLAYIVPYMLVTLVAKGISEAVIEPSIYDVAIQIKKLPFLHMSPLESDHKVAFGIHARDIMTSEVVCISLTQNWDLRWVLTLLTDFTFSHYPVVEDIDNRVLQGVVDRKELLHAFDLANKDAGFVSRNQRVRFAGGEIPGALDLSQLVKPVLITAHPDNNLSHVHHLFVQLGLSYMMFAEEGRLVGVLSKKAFLARLEKLRQSGPPSASS